MDYWVRMYLREEWTDRANELLAAGGRRRFSITPYANGVVKVEIPGGYLGKLCWSENIQQGFIKGSLRRHENEKGKPRPTSYVIATKHPMYRKGLYISVYSPGHHYQDLDNIRLVYAGARGFMRMSVDEDPVLGALRVYQKEAGQAPDWYPPLLICQSMKDEAAP